MTESLFTPAIERIAISLDFGFTNVSASRAATVLRLLAVDRDNEKDARHKVENALRQRDQGMEDLFDLLRLHGVDYSHLIS